MQKAGMLKPVAHAPPTIAHNHVATSNPSEPQLYWGSRPARLPLVLDLAGLLMQPWLVITISSTYLEGGFHMQWLSHANRRSTNKLSAGSPYHVLCPA